MRLINKAGLLAGALTTLLILASCSDSDTSTGVTTGKQLANDSSTQVVMHQGTAGEGEHSNPDTNHGHSPEQQHAEPNNPTTSSVVALLSISNPSCGNLIQEDTEQCDGGLGGNATCNTDCTLKTLHGEVIATAACGNGIVDPGEQCDDANDSNEDDCTRFCKTPVCGDGYVQGSNGEQCDDKNRIDTDGCNNQCQRQQSTAVVTTTTVTEQVNDDGGTTRTTTTPTTPTTPTTTTTTGGGTTTTTSDLCEVTPVVAEGGHLSVSGAFTKTSGLFTVRPNEFATFNCKVSCGDKLCDKFTYVLVCTPELIGAKAGMDDCVADSTPPAIATGSCSQALGNYYCPEDANGDVLVNCDFDFQLIGDCPDVTPQCANDNDCDSGYTCKVAGKTTEARYMCVEEEVVKLSATPTRGGCRDELRACEMAAWERLGWDSVSWDAKALGVAYGECEVEYNDCTGALH